MSENSLKLAKSSKTILIVEPAAGYTVGQLKELIAQGTVQVMGDQLVQECPPPAEGFSIVGNVSGRENDDQDWTVVVEHQHKGCCAVLTVEERHRNFANSIRFKANELAAAGHLAEASELLNSVAALLDLSGGRENESGLWYLASQGDICSRIGDFLDAELKLNEALVLALKLFGEAHPATGVSYLNHAEVLIELESWTEAAFALSKAETILAACEPSGDYTAEYLAGASTNVEQMKTRLPF